MGGCNPRLALIVEFHLGTSDKAVTTENKLVLRIPYNQLVARSRHGIEFVDVAILSCSATGAAECDFAQTPDFAHGIGA